MCYVAVIALMAKRKQNRTPRHVKKNKHLKTWKIIIRWDFWNRYQKEQLHSLHTRRSQRGERTETPKDNKTKPTTTRTHPKWHFIEKTDITRPDQEEYQAWDVNKTKQRKTST